MKKLAIAILALICILLALNSTSLRVAQGVVEGRMYIEDGDYVNTTLTTTDGESWVAEGYTAPIGDKVLIIYDQCDKSTIYDDEIVYIIHFTDFTK